MGINKKYIDISNPFHKIFLLIIVLTITWFLWEQWDVDDFFYPEYWIDEGKERTAILIIIGCIIGFSIFRNEK